jgi:hypothetical protein
MLGKQPVYYHCSRFTFHASRLALALYSLNLARICAMIFTAMNNTPLQECSGSFSLSGIKVQSTQMEEDVRLEALFVPIPKGLFDQTLDFIVEALNGTIG